MLSVGSLRSAKYGSSSIVVCEEKNLTISKGSLVQAEETTSVSRYSKVLMVIFACLDSVVEGGLVEIDPTKQTSAGSPLG